MEENVIENTNCLLNFTLVLQNHKFITHIPNNLSFRNLNTFVNLENLTTLYTLSNYMNSLTKTTAHFVGWQKSGRYYWSINNRRLRI